MKKLGKTATRILTRMNHRYGTYAATCATGNGPEGGKIRAEGAREYDACRELVAKGYAVETNRRSFVVINRGWGVHCSEIGIKLV